MIDINLRFQLALFGNYEDISPKPDTLKYLIDAFADRELIPTTVQELDLVNPLNPINRLSLKSTDEVWSIDFGADRIDIQKNNKDIGVVTMGDFKEFLEEAKIIVELIDKRFPKKHNRLAVVSRYLLKKMTSKEMSELFYKNVNTIEIFKVNEPIEWNNRVVTRVKKKISENEEIINIVADFNRIKGNLFINSNNEIIDRAELRFDINTYQGTTDFRFEFKDLISFVDQAASIEDKLQQDYINLLR
ncbi:hypothetical protein [Flavobacterium sp.]|uniref:hypothetical protein n=1 Tax=Flavobacterium sp. TaxID=239 RepID=UPI003B9935F7